MGIQETSLAQSIPSFSTYVSHDGQHALVRLIGELDIAAVATAERAIAWAERRRPLALEVDLSTLAFMDSTGLRLMLGTRDRAEADGRELRVRRGPSPVQRVFEMTELTQLFHFVD